MLDVFSVGGTTMVMKELMKHGLLHTDCITVNGQTIGQNLADAPDLPSDQDVIYPCR
jgi:dihydroxy-acid dehydratase